MYRIVYYEDKDGKSELYDELMELTKNSKTRDRKGRKREK